VITDTLGLLLGAGVGPASDTGGQCLPDLLQRLLGKVPRLKVIFADSDYKGVPGSLMWRCFHWVLSIVEREDRKADSIHSRSDRPMNERPVGLAPIAG
jgi:hypothetical protein